MPSLTVILGFRDSNDAHSDDHQHRFQGTKRLAKFETGIKVAIGLYSNIDGTPYCDDLHRFGPFDILREMLRAVFPLVVSVYTAPWL